MDINYFKQQIAPQLTDYTLTYSSYSNGDFGNLERADIEGNSKSGYIDFWSMGWLNIDIFDWALEEQVLNILLRPTEVQEQKDAIEKFIEILLK